MTAREREELIDYAIGKLTERLIEQENLRSKYQG